jgi:Domain of unknown function (DUF4169)
MGDIVNLRRARKARARSEADKAAEVNRVAFGRSKSEREISEKEKALAARRLDGHERVDREPGDANE